MPAGSAQAHRRTLHTGGSAAHHPNRPYTLRQAGGTPNVLARQRHPCRLWGEADRRPQPQTGGWLPRLRADRVA